MAQLKLNVGVEAVIEKPEDVDSVEEVLQAIKGVLDKQKCKDCGKSVSKDVIGFCNRQGFDGVYCINCQPKHKPSREGN